MSAVITHPAPEGHQARAAPLLERGNGSSGASRGESHSQQGGGRDPPLASRLQARFPPTLQHSVPPQGLISLATLFYDENGQEGGSSSAPCVPLVQGTDYPLMEPSRGHHGPGPRKGDVSQSK